METYQIQLNNGQVIVLNNVEGFDSKAFTFLLNKRDTLFVDIAGSIINKNIILAVVKVEEGEAVTE